MGSQAGNELISAIFEVRTLIFGTGPLYPYVDSGFYCPEYLKKLHFDRFFMDHPISFSPYNDGISVAQLPLLAHFSSENGNIWHVTSPSICELGA